MAMNVGEAFLDNAEQGQLTVAIQTLDRGRKIERYLNPTPFGEPFDVVRKCGLKANIIEQGRIQEVRHGANVLGHLYDQ